MKTKLFVAAAAILLSFAGYSVQAQTVPAKYEGGMFGYQKKESGLLRFDDANRRLVFFGKDQKEKFSLPYDSIIAVEPTRKSVQSVGATTAGVVAGSVVPGGGLLGMIRENRRYVTIQFSDPDVEARGTVSFKVGGAAQINSTIRTLGEKAALTQRGEAYYRPVKARTGNQVN